MAMSESENDFRERFYTCDEETLEDFIGFIDTFDNMPMNTKENETKSSKSLQCKRKRPTTKTSKKELLLKCYENQRKTRCKKADKSPPPKVVKYGVSGTDKGESESGDGDGDEENEDEDEENNDEEVIVIEKVEVDEIIKLDENNVIEKHEGNIKKHVIGKEHVGKPDVMAEDEMTVNLEERHSTEKKCIDCHKLYRDNKDDKVKRKCRICKCNEHGCLMLLNNIISKGDTWLCGECLQLTKMVESKHPDLYENLRKALVKQDKKGKIARSDQNKTLVNKMRTASNSRGREKEEKREGAEEKLQKKNILNPRVPLSYRDNVVAFNGEDLRSLNDGEWISDAIIAFWFRYLEEVVYQNNQNILFISPSVTQVLKQGLTDVFSTTANSLNIGQKEYVLMAVNNNKLDKAGGYHWSLVVYKVKDDVWLHYDSMDPVNLKEAKSLVSRMQEYIEPGSTPMLFTMGSTQQKNNCDCGAYTMINAGKVALMLTRELGISQFRVEKEDIANLRNKVCELLTSPEQQKIKDVSAPSNFDGVKDNILIDSQNSMFKKPLQPNPQPRNTTNKSTTTNLGLADVKKYPNINRDKICPFLTRGTCRYGAKGENNLGKCQKYHPNQCKEYNLNGTTEKGCKKGKECSDWHATYICLLSANSNMCTRINCQFKHHKSCTTTKDNDNFLESNQHYKIPKLYQSLEYLPLINRQPPQHQRQRRHHHHQRYQHQPQKMHLGHSWQANNKIPHTNQRQYNKQPQVSEDRLIHLIRTVIREETNNHC